MRGRKPVPTVLKIVRGNPGNRTLPKDEPAPPPLDLGEPAPEWLSPDAAKVWPAIAKQLHSANVLSKLDAHALGLYCEAFARWKDANDKVVKLGAVVKVPKSGYPIQSPYLAIANKAYDQMTKMLVEFGMTPSSRSRVTKVKGRDGEDGGTGGDSLSEFKRAG